MRTRGISGGLTMIAVGAILYWGITAEGEGFNINTIGIILMVIGFVGILLTLVMAASADEQARVLQEHAYAAVEPELHRPWHSDDVVRKMVEPHRGVEQSGSSSGS